MMEHTKEEHAIILDFLPNGYPLDERPMYMKTAIAQALGMEHFVLLELVPKKDVHLQIYDQVYIGDGKRDKVHHIAGKIMMSRLTRTAKSELEFVIKDIVLKNEERFIRFFNEARPLSTRMHQIELLPGVGKRHMWEIINAREDEPFKDFDDLKERVKLIPNPEKLIIKRILEELEGTEKHRIFVDVG